MSQPMRAAPLRVSHRLRATSLSLPQAKEVVIERGPTFRVEDKIFALDRAIEGRPSVWCKAPKGGQEALIGADAKRFFSPPYYGAKGWIGMWLDGAPDWGEVETLVRRSYRLVAPKRLAALVE